MAAIKVPPAPIYPNQANGHHHQMTYGNYTDYGPWINNYGYSSSYNWKPQVPKTPYQSYSSGASLMSAELPSPSPQVSDESFNESGVSIAFKSDDSCQGSKWSFEESDIDEEVPPLPPPLDVSLLSEKRKLDSAKTVTDTFKSHQA